MENSNSKNFTIDKDDHIDIDLIIKKLRPCFVKLTDLEVVLVFLKYTIRKIYSLQLKKHLNMTPNLL